MEKEFEVKINLKNREETLELARDFATNIKAPFLITLSGDLGAGKTTFVGGVLANLGYDKPVVSPTFNILKCYFEIKPHIYHIDAYRLEDQNIELGLEDYLEGDGICFVEWPNYIAPLLPNNRIDISIRIIDESMREFTILDRSGLYVDFLKKIAGNNNE